jgi:magnesium-transporting ATPase (P-type)
VIEIFMNYIGGGLQKLTSKRADRKVPLTANLIFYSLSGGGERERNFSKPASQFAFSSFIYNWLSCICSFIRSFVFLLLLKSFIFFLGLFMIFFVGFCIIACGGNVLEPFLGFLAGFFVPLDYYRGGGVMGVNCSLLYRRTDSFLW